MGYAMMQAMHFPYAPQANERDHPFSTIVLTEEGAAALRGRFESNPGWNPDDTPYPDKERTKYLVPDDAVSVSVRTVELLADGWVRASTNISSTSASVARIDLLLPQSHIVAIYSSSTVNSTLSADTSFDQEIATRRDNLNAAEEKQ
ncbi:hypothetical protein [uncultured Gordonia sp.]|uniref:hypothetical protein n=1 Tax=uncultured Gordonia sp. TaxID=198437 RepID=UPI002591FABC|nr:hypothetical protein [uncultured Gordonia sp.]